MPRAFKKSMLAIAVLLIVGFGIYLIAEPNSGNDEPASIIRSTEPQIIATGKKLYEQYCASCHGVKLQGEANWRQRKPDGTLPAPPHDATGHTWHHPDRVLFAYTKIGGARFTRGAFKSAMPGFEDQLTDREIATVIAYIKSSWPKEIRDRQQSISEMDRKRRR